ncbi:MAG: DegT/DnrJ/EryC1/StrS family aminotransferase [Bryobacterales bacterium]|nr:DegT/DnrJ/EryC1/StrS family aminotransferase [Bryobacterales bacterium]MBV9401764.1 DegT/DnrJ/EryC1/StrS family aminotransferase [Bryobacterales bacterium]
MPYPFDATSRTAFHVARGGIFHLFRALAFRPKETVFAPDYHSGSEVAAIHAAGARTILYPIARNFEIDMDAFRCLFKRHTPRAVYVIHYLGWPQPIEEIARLCIENECVLIEDCALALLSCLGKRPLGSFGDYSVFCLYKTLPVPNGGMLVQNRHRMYNLLNLRLDPCPPAAVAGRCAELALEALRSRFDLTGKALFSLKQSIGRRMRSAGVKHAPVGNLAWNINLVNLAMSPVSDRVIKGLDYSSIREKRRANFEHLQQRIGDRVCMPRRDLPEGMCPLFFPVLVRDKRATAQALRRKGVEAVEFWSDRQKPAGISPDAMFLRDHVLELPIHQGVNSSQIEFIADEVLRLNPEPPC